MSQKVEIDGVETVVYTTDEYNAGIATTKTQVEGEWKPKVDDLTGKLTDAERAAAKRAAEFGAARGEFQRLSDEQQSKLSAIELTLYKNQELIAEKDKQLGESSKVAHASAVDAAIRAKVGTNQKLFEETKKMYDLIGIEDNTPEGIKNRATAALGALSTTAPDLLASAGFGGGSFEPPQAPGEGGTSFADSERGKAGAAELGIILEAPAKK